MEISVHNELQTLADWASKLEVLSITEQAYLRGACWALARFSGDSLESLVAQVMDAATPADPAGDGEVLLAQSLAAVTESRLAQGGIVTGGALLYGEHLDGMDGGFVAIAHVQRAAPGAFIPDPTITVPGLAPLPEGITTEAAATPQEVSPIEALGTYADTGMNITREAQEPSEADLSQPPSPPTPGSYAEDFVTLQASGAPIVQPLDPEELAEVRAELAKREVLTPPVPVTPTAL